MLRQDLSHHLMRKESDMMRRAVSLEVVLPVILQMSWIIWIRKHNKTRWDAIGFDQKQRLTVWQGPQNIDVAWLRKMALNFEKKINKNTELRSKYENSPQKYMHSPLSLSEASKITIYRFMGSEADLDADIKALSILSQHPDLYEEFVRLGCVSSLVSLLSHENTDIAIDAIEIIKELTDEDVDAEQAQWDALVDAMLESDLLNLLYENINRMDEDTESDRAGTYHMLGIIENLSSRSSVSLDIGRHTKFIDWLLLRISKQAARITQNEQYSAEILTILLQSVPENRQVFISKDGIDTCLQLLSAYRKRDPTKGTDEEELVENIFDCLTCCVDETDGKTKFLDAEGIELCLIMLREGKMSRPRALRLLDHALSGNDGGLGCERLVEAAGLKIIFNLYMKSQDNGMTEHLLGILSSLLRSVTANSELRIRLMAKFEEKNWKVVDRLLQDRRRLASAIHTVDEQIKLQKRQLSTEAQEEQADEWFSRRLDAGSFTLQTLDIIIAWLVAEDETGKNGIKKQLVDGGESLQDVKRTLQGTLIAPTTH